MVSHYRAQSFTPTLGKLTRVKLLLSNKVAENSCSYLLSICNSLDPYNPVDGMNVPGVKPPKLPDKAWIEFDFPDIDVNVGRPYYIVVTSACRMDNWHAWHAQVVILTPVACIGIPWTRLLDG